LYNYKRINLSPQNYAQDPLLERIIKILGSTSYKRHPMPNKLFDTAALQKMASESQMGSN
jgi:hypothetical protein